MKKLEIKLKNCYGIKELDQEFNFDKIKCQLVYAQNGMMKSSFAKTFYRLSKGEDPEELVYGRNPEYEIKIDEKENRKDYLEKIIYVVHSEPKYFESDKISTLLVDEINRKKYQDEISKIDNEKIKLLTFLKQKTGIRGDDKLILAFVNDFGKNEKDFLDILNSEKIINFGYQDINYGLISKSKVEQLLGDKEIVYLLEEYIETYEELIGQSKYFSKGVFNHNNGENVYDSLGANNFFIVEHKVKLKGETVEIDSCEDLVKKIDSDRDRIFTDPKLLQKFKKIDDKLKGHEDLRSFRSYIESNKHIISELKNFAIFKKKVWISYLFEGKSFLDSLLSVYSSSKVIITDIIKEAKKQELEWHNIINEFNDTFNPFYSLKIDNQEDIILKGVKVPQIVFDYDEKLGVDPKRISKDTLDKVLSTGEKRTLFILNLLFELAARKKDGLEHLIILDDIADSFDYSNKYSIIEYLKELSEEDNNLFFIILTHNFDFFRTVQYRFFGIKYREQSYIVNKHNNGELKLLKAGYFKPFEHFKDSFHNKKDIFVATIPFVRNLIDYSEGENQEYIDLTCCLHKKNNTDNLKISDIFSILNKKLGNNRTLSSSFDVSKNIFVFIKDVAKEIYNSPQNGLNLENKVVLSITIRLLGEEIMILDIEKKDATIRSRLESIHNQTRFLFEEYKKYYSISDQKGKLIKKVILLTPENIHLNSFMYEPILDTSENELRELYFGLINI